MFRLPTTRRVTGVVVFATAFAALNVAYTQAPDEAKAWAHQELKWVKDTVLPSVQSVLLWGDPARGEHGMLRKFPAGYAPAPHTHPSVERVVVISGSVVVRHSGSAEKVLGPGSYSEIPPNVVHSVRCAEQSDCEFVLTSSGPFDIVPADKGLR
jgi:quercetin dioxygenase-like cupin family protein